MILSIFLCSVLFYSVSVIDNNTLDLFGIPESNFNVFTSNLWNNQKSLFHQRLCESMHPDKTFLLDLNLVHLKLL